MDKGRLLFCHPVRWRKSAGDGLLLTYLQPSIKPLWQPSYDNGHVVGPGLPWLHYSFWVPWFILDVLTGASNPLVELPWQPLPLYGCRLDTRPHTYCAHGDCRVLRLVSHSLTGIFIFWHFALNIKKMDGLWESTLNHGQEN